jgi:hypothetical protein
MKNSMRLVLLIVIFTSTKICTGQDTISQDTSYKDKYLDSKIQYSIKKRLLSSINAVHLFDNAESDSSLIYWLFSYEKNNFTYTILEADTMGVFKYCIVEIADGKDETGTPLLYYKRNDSSVVGRFFNTFEGLATSAIYFVDIGKSIAFDLSYYENNNFFEFINYIRTTYYPYIKLKKPFEYRKKRYRKQYFFTYEFKSVDFEKLFKLLFEKSKPDYYYFGY